MLRSQALSALFDENLDTIANAIFLTTITGHLIGASSSSPSLPASLTKKASILSSSTFAYHAQKSQVDDSSSTHSTLQQSSHLNGSNQSAMTATSVSYLRTPSTSSLPYNALGQSQAGYLSIQPLDLVSRTDWTPDGNDNDDDDDSEAFTGSNLRRIVVEIPVGKFIDVSNGDQRKVTKVSRLCAVEGIGRELVIGILGGEERVDGETKERDKEGSTMEGDDAECETGVVELEQNHAQARRKARAIRLLEIKTEALAEFMREEFGEFSMPDTVV